MNIKLFRFLLFPLFALASALAGENSPSPILPPIEVPAGLLVSLTASGYKFIVADTPAQPTLRRLAVAEQPGARWKHSFVAGAVVANRSRSDIKFTFPDTANAALKWAFRVLDAAGAEVWHSDADVVGAEVETEQTLAHGKCWRRVIEVPLALGEEPLAPGVYTLEATVAADKPISATSIFEVVAKPELPADSGINGHVVKLPPPESATPVAAYPVPGAIINISEIRLDNARYSTPPFNWVGRAGDDGNFTVKTPPGRFRVTATEPITVDPPVPTNTVSQTLIPRAPLSKTVEVTVEQGHFSEVTIQLNAPPVESNQGIAGLVLAGPISPVAQVGQPNEAPVVGAHVTVEEIREVQIAIYPAPPLFHWSGTTDENGRFSLHTPVGKFRVTASFPLLSANTEGTALVRLPALETVEVEAGKYSEVTLHLDTGIR
jgi:hypothetical protein